MLHHETEGNAVYYKTISTSTEDYSPSGLSRENSALQGRVVGYNSERDVNLDRIPMYYAQHGAQYYGFLDRIPMCSGATSSLSSVENSNICALHTEHCTLHTEHCTLNTAH